MSTTNLTAMATAIAAMRKTLDKFGVQLKTSLDNAGKASQVSTDLDTTIQQLTQAFTDATTDLKS